MLGLHFPSARPSPYLASRPTFVRALRLRRCPRRSLRRARRRQGQVKSARSDLFCSSSTINQIHEKRHLNGTPFSRLLPPPSRLPRTDISQTPAALDRLRSLVSSPTEPKLLRIGVKSRGCAGMAYHLDYVPPPGERFDEVVEQDGVRVLIDSKALFSIIGSRMDWRDNRLSAGFVFDK